MGCGAILWAFVLCAPIRFKFWCHFAINCNWMSWIFISQPTILHNVTYLYQSALWELPCEYYWLTFTFIPTFTLIFMCWRLRLFWRICATETDVFTLGSWLRQKVCPYILRFNLLMVFCFQTDHHPHHCHCHRQVDKQINWIEEKNMQIHFAKLYWTIHTQGCKKNRALPIVYTLIPSKNIFFSNIFKIFAWYCGLGLARLPNTLHFVM